MSTVKSLLGFLVALPLLGGVSVARAEDASEHWSGILDRYDSDGDGRLHGDELDAFRNGRGARRSDFRAGLLEQYDADGDGRLTGDERRAARDDHPRLGRHRGCTGRKGRAADAGG